MFKSVLPTQPIHQADSGVVLEAAVSNEADKHQIDIGHLLDVAKPPQPIASALRSHPDSGRM